MNTFNAPKGTPPAIQFVEIASLKVDDSYQRSADTARSQSLIKNIAENWDWRLCVPLTVSQREGGLYVLDGQHRLAAARMRGDIIHLPASVSVFSNISEEALLFVQANVKRKKFTPFDEFRARIAAGDPKALVTQELVSDAGLSIAPHSARQNWKLGQIGIFKPIERAVRMAGKANVSAALTVMGEAFREQKMGSCGNVFWGLVNLFWLEKYAVDPDDLLETMKTMSCLDWEEHPFLEEASAGSSRYNAMSRAILHEMNEVSHLDA